MSGYAEGYISPFEEQKRQHEEYLHRRIAELEAEVERLRSVPREPMPGEIDHEMLRQHNEALRAEVERLKCCGNCDHIDTDDYHHFEQCFPGTGEPCFKVDVQDHCHFTPSRWAERGGEK